MTPKNQDNEHQLKVWPVYYKRIQSGEKSFELRKNDRDFQTGDFVSLNEWDPKTQTYSGNQTDVKITYVLQDPKFGLKKGFCVFGFKKP